MDEIQHPLATRARSKSVAFIQNMNSFELKKARSWEPTLEKAIRAIVSIKASHVRSFDTETSGKKNKIITPLKTC